MKNFLNRVYEAVLKIPPGKFLTYKEVAKSIGSPKSSRAVGQILAKNRNRAIPCHRVVKNDNTIGGYFGSYKNSWKKLALLLKEGVIAVIPTDTIYGICGSALKKETVEKIYKLRKRNLKKPMIILISSFDDLKIFGIDIKNENIKKLKKIWPASVSVIIDYKGRKFDYLSRGSKTIAFRFPNDPFLIKILKISGPLVAPSANLEGEKPAETISEARRYFGKEVLYYEKKRMSKKPSTIIRIKDKKIEVIRRGVNFLKLKALKIN